ncbi:serine/threonine protein kinase [Phytophthora cinnamomi]|uniref:serine/threonine protein kinase n=1 Tax=Phytophthora cinnamomi TaxID=4785 RepID=UPI003559CAB6|nr:serine/threonine protein kinase [Phytophthora cinnamomi]
MSERSMMLSRRGSSREEEDLTVGAVVVMLSDKAEDQSAAAYRLPTGDAGQDDSKPISTAAPQKEQRFMAVLAPSCDAAMASLLSQPPGTYLLVKEEDAAITVYVKFRQAVRALTLVKGKDVKKNDDAIHLAKLRKKDVDVLQQTPVHMLRLTLEAYFLVEHCWKRFLPQVQAVVFELCSEPYFDEDTKLEDWNSSMIPTGYALALMPEACGFYILASHSADPDSSSSAVIQIRQVEFDFNKFAITVVDGTLKPSALLLSTSFSAKKTFEPYFTFSAIRDNFMSPDQSDNILVRSSAQELSRRLLEHENEDEHEDDASHREFKAWLCIADFGEAKLADSHQLPRTEKFVSLSRTRGTEAIKSPEVLTIKGSEDVEVKVTLASDIWSLGCLLYELATQELLFQNDDWAGLYAHLVVTQDQAVFRSDHKQKLFKALKPSCAEEEEVVAALAELCSKILSRDARKRPKLEAIAKQARKLINDVYELPVTARDEAFIISLYQSNGETPAPTSDAQRSLVPSLRPFASARPRSRRPDANGVTVPVRFFWNLFLAAHVTQTQDGRAVTSCLGNGFGPVSKDVLAMEAFEAKHEGDFVHFVYLAWHDSSAPPGGPDARESLVEELYEDEHRTVWQLNPHLKASVETQLTSDVHLFQQLVQHAPLYFPVVQRRLREAAGCVVFVVLGRDADDTKELQHVLTGMLLFFLRSAMGMSAFELLSCFARDCAQFFDYPRAEFLQHFLSYSVAEDTTTTTLIQCRCGASVLSVEASAMSEALATQRCTCNSSVKCPCFHPFPVGDDGPADVDDDVFPVNSMFVHDDYEEQLVHPLESRSKRGQEVRWIAVDSVSVSRADGAAFRWSPTGPRPGRGVSIESTRSMSVDGGSGSERRVSRFDILKRRASKVAGDGVASPRLSGKETAVRAVAEPQELQKLLVRGLQHRGKPADPDAPSSHNWELYECALCRLPICALAESKVAVPLMLQQHPRSSDQRSMQ